MNPLSAVTDSVWTDAPARLLREVLDKEAQPLFGNATGELYYSDDSLPEDHSAVSWRCLQVPRLHLLLDGEHTLHFVKAGEITERHLQPGDQWFYPRDAHDNETFTTRCRYLAVVFYEKITRFVIVTHDPDAPHTRLNSQRVFWKHERPPALEHSLEAITAALGDEQKRAGQCLAQALWRLIHAWVRAIAPHSAPALMGKAHESWLNVDRFIQENYHRPLTRESVSQAVHLHPNRISALCRQFDGKSFQEILEERRIRQAKRFLEHTGHKIETVSVLCGYTSAPYFSRAFRKSSGMTPGQWRLRHGKFGQPAPFKAGARYPDQRK